MVEVILNRNDTQYISVPKTTMLPAPDPDLLPTPSATVFDSDIQLHLKPRPSSNSLSSSTSTAPTTPSASTALIGEGRYDYDFSSSLPTDEGEGVKLLHKYYCLGVPYMSVSWCYLGNKHVYHIMGIDPFYWLALFSLGTLYSNVLLTSLILLFWGFVIMYTFQETPILSADDDSDSSSDDSSDSDDDGGRNMHGGVASADDNKTEVQQSRTIRRSISVPLGKAGIRRRASTWRHPSTKADIDPESELKSMFS